MHHWGFFVTPGRVLIPEIVGFGERRVIFGELPGRNPGTVGPVRTFRSRYDIVWSVGGGSLHAEPVKPTSILSRFGNRVGRELSGHTEESRWSSSITCAQWASVGWYCWSSL
jgi:hypothetical protein